MKDFLIGMPGCGKSTVVDLYEEIYGEQVCDTDSIITLRYGNVNEIFRDFGEQYFRDLETEVIRELCRMDEDMMIATGGGAVLREENVKLLKASGKVIYLRAKIETLLNRLENDTSRPLLRGSKSERLTKLYYERTPVYESVADVIIDTDGLTPRQVLNKIFCELDKIRGGSV